jgi:NTE family protein
MNSHLRSRSYLRRIITPLILLSSIAVGQEPQPLKRPKIALVLSGGAARGLAHVGVITWLDEHHIPVDYVVGTSMGGLIGSMYATGMTPAEMRKFIEDINWEEAQASEPRYDQLSFRRKEDRRAYQIGIPLGLAHGINGPNGFNPGHGVGLLLDRVSLPYSALASFDELPIPFRCVATDLLQGKAVVLKDGSLGEALRSTMAIPGVYTPVESHGTILSDGGLVDNIPTDVGRNLGADVVIAVDVTSPLGDRQTLQTLAGVLDQAVDVMTIEHDRLSRDNADIVVAPDLKRFTADDYTEARQIMDAGYQAAERRAIVLSRFAVGADEWLHYIEARRQRERHPELTIDALQVQGVSAKDQLRLETRLEKYLDHPLNTKKLETDLTRIIGEGRYDRLGYEFFREGDAQGLRIRAHEKTYGPPFIDLAVDVSGSGVGAFDFSAGARFTFMNVGGHGAEWRTDVRLGSKNFFATEWYQPLGTPWLFVAPYGFFTKQARGIFQNGERIADFRDRRVGTGLDIGFNSGRSSELRVGYKITDSDFGLLVGQPITGVNGTTDEVRALWTFDNQDSPVVPSRGVRATVELSHVFNSPGTNHSFRQLDVQSSTFVPLIKRGSMFVNTGFGTSFNHDPGVLRQFALGGPFRLGAYSPYELLGSHYLFGSVGYRHQLLRLPDPIGHNVYAGAWYETGSAFPDYDSVSLVHSFNAGVIAETFMGPVGLSFSVSPTGRAKANFSIGRLF